MLRTEMPETALILALSRQESEFNQFAVSSAGARGLMQLMPATAKGVARDLKLGYQPAKLTDDATYNVRLGAHYLRSEAHTSELQSLMRISYAVFCLKKQKTQKTTT